MKRASEDLNTSILQLALDPVIVLDHEGRVIEFNRAAEHTFGRSREEVMGQEMAELLIAPALRERHRDAIARCAAAAPGQLQRFESTALRADGREFPVELALTRVSDREPPAFAGYLRDITAHKVNEERLHHQHREIAQLAAERGQLVAQVLDAEDRTRRRIAQTLHDDALQSLLAANQDLIEASPGRAGLSRAHRAVENAIDKLRSAVHSLHPVTLEHGGLETALNAICEEDAARGRFRYTVRVQPEAVGHQDDLIIALARELVTNAARHAQASRVAVVVDQTGDAVRLQVADDGRGFDPKRRQAAIREGHVGLASIAQRLEVVGGDLQVVSEPGRGTVVRGRIPAALPAKRRARGRRAVRT